MENGIGVFCVPLQELYGFFRWEDDQFDFVLLSLTSNLIHDWKCSGARADHQPAAFPRCILCQRERRVAESFPKLLRWFLRTPANFSLIDHDVIAVLNAIDPNFSK